MSQSLQTQLAPLNVPSWQKLQFLIISEDLELAFAILICFNKLRAASFLSIIEITEFIGENKSETSSESSVIIKSLEIFRSGKNVDGLSSFSDFFCNRFLPREVLLLDDPGIGRFAFCSFLKYFWTLLAICLGVRFPISLAIFANRLLSTTSGGNLIKSSSSRFCSSSVQKITACGFFVIDVGAGTEVLLLVEATSVYCE